MENSHKIDYFTRKNFLAILLILIGSLKLFYSPVNPSDLYIWSAVGQKMIELKSFLYQDYFSVHDNLEFLYPSQVSSFFYGIIYKSFGDLGLFIFSRAMSFFFLLFLASRYLKNLNANFINLFLPLSSVIGCFYMLDRPAGLIFPLALLTFEMMFNENDLDKIDLLKLFFLVLIWVNLHPSALILLIVPIIRVAIDLSRLRAELKKVLIVLWGILINPIGVKIFSYAFVTSVVSKNRELIEWQSILTFEDKSCLVIFAFSLFLLINALIKSKELKKYFYSGYWIFVGLPLISVRHLIFYSLSQILLFYQFKFFDYQNVWYENKKVNISIITALILLNLFLITSNFSENNMFDENAEVTILNYLKNKNKMRVFSEMDNGYLANAMVNTNNKIFFDSRNIIYSNQAYEDFIKMKSGQMIEEKIERYHFNLIVCKIDKSLCRKLENSKWKEVFKGRFYKVFQP